MTQTSKKKIVRYLAFYLIEGMWADAKPDYSKFGSEYWIKSEYWALMSERVVEYKDGNRAIVVLRDGMIQYTDLELTTGAFSAGGADFERIQKYGAILNAIFAIFVSKIVEKTNRKYHTNFELSHFNFIPISYENGKFSSMGLPQKTATDKQLDIHWLNNVPEGYIDNLDYWIDSPARGVIDKAILEEAARTFFKIEALPGGVTLLSRSNKSSAEYASMQFSDSILSAWAQVEVYLFKKLSEYMVSQGSRKFPRKRRDSMMRNTASQVIDILEIAGQLSAPMYSLLDKVRRARNQIVHTGYQAKNEEATDALKLLEEVILEFSGEKILLNTGLSWQGF